jgi:hypothetical protein
MPRFSSPTTSPRTYRGVQWQNGEQLDVPFFSPTVPVLNCMHTPDFFPGCGKHRFFKTVPATPKTIGANHGAVRELTSGQRDPTRVIVLSYGIPCHGRRLDTCPMSRMGHLFLRDIFVLTVEFDVLHRRVQHR